MGRGVLEKHGRLTTGNAPLHIRRKHLTNDMRDVIKAMLEEAIKNHG